MSHKRQFPDGRRSSIQKRQSEVSTEFTREPLNPAPLPPYKTYRQLTLTAVHIAASENKGAVFAPLAMGGAAVLRANGLPGERLACWLDGKETACLTAMRHMDDSEA